MTLLEKITNSLSDSMASINFAVQNHLTPDSELYKQWYRAWRYVRKKRDIGYPEKRKRAVIILTELQVISPRESCEYFFGVNGKATVKAYLSAIENESHDLIQWASKLAYNDSNSVQKILALQNYNHFEPEAVVFLNSLPMQTRIKMVGKTTFRHRGVEKSLNSAYVKDTGYLWCTLRNKPKLGRVRCWFSVHEVLAKKAVEEQPDEEIPVAEKWKPLDGLCAVDGKWEVVLPKSTVQLKHWGNLLKNCVGGYGPRIKSGECTVFAIRENGIITHCAEINHFDRLDQFVSERNDPPNPEIKKSVKNALLQSGVVRGEVLDEDEYLE